MKPKTHNVAEQFKSFVERIERLDQERVDLSNDMADVYKEVRAADFNPKAMKALISERRRERRDPAAFRSAAELLEQYRDLLDGTDHALTRAPRARSEQSAGAPSPNGPQAPNPPVSVPAEPIPESAAGASTRKDEELRAALAGPVTPAVEPSSPPDVAHGDTAKSEGRESDPPKRWSSGAETHSGDAAGSGTVPCKDGSVGSIPTVSTKLPTVTLDDGTTVVPATHLPPPSVMAMRSSLNRNRPARDSNFDFAQSAPSDDAQIPQFLRRGARA